MLETTWFLIWGLLWTVYFVLDGFDFGVGMLFPWLGTSEAEKSSIFHSIAPYWDGNEVWLITAGGVTFAAFPAAYAVLFSSLYTPLLLVLFALIIRGVCMEFRGKVDNHSWRTVLSAGIFMGSLLPTILFGIIFAGIFAGIPVDAEGVYHGSSLDLLNPYGITGGLLFFLLFLNHGALWVAMRLGGTISDRAASLSRRLWIPLAIATITFLVLTGFFSTVWENYLVKPKLLAIPFIGVAALGASRYYVQKHHFGRAFASSAVLIGSAVLFGILGIFPALLPSTLDPAYSLTISNSASGPLTLRVMLVVAAIVVPIVILYQLWAYKLFRKEGAVETRAEAQTEEAY